MKQSVIAYCRVSTDNQKEEGTINLQIQEIKTFCTKQNFELVTIFRDEGISGASEQRPGLSDMFTYLESKEGKDVSSIVIWKLDRLARDLYIQEYLVRKFELLNKRLISTKETDLDSKDPMRKAFRQFMGIVSELEKSFITMRLSGGRLNKARKGGYAGGKAPLGYLVSESELKPQEGEREAVRLIFKLRRQGLSYGLIANRLNEMNTPTKQGKKWYGSTIRYAFKNPIYKGNYRYGSIQVKNACLTIKASKSG